MIKLILLAVIILAATVSAAYTLNLLDSIVHGQLYHYGLQFSLEWANPYWNLLRIVQILLGVIIISTILSAIFTFRKYVYVKKASTMPVAPSATPAPTSLPFVTSELIKCFHCGKVLTQPLRTLDFQGDIPRIVNICPFCNEVIPSVPRQDWREHNK